MGSTQLGEEVNDIDFLDLPLIGTADSDNAYCYARALREKFPEQAPDDFAYAVQYNRYDQPDAVAFKLVADLVCENKGERDAGEWEWRVTFTDGSVWKAVGWCDFTGWDCRSGLTWTELIPADTITITISREDAETIRDEPKAWHPAGARVAGAIDRALLKADD